MMNIVTTLQKDRFTPRFYVAALTDNMSLQKAQVYEESLIEVEVTYHVALYQTYAGNCYLEYDYSYFLFRVVEIRLSRMPISCRYIVVVK